MSTHHRVVTCFSPKGGVGCSMIAVNLAVALQIRARRTVLLDGSLSSGTVDLFLGLAPTNALLHLVRADQEISDFSTQQALVRHTCGLHVLLAPRDPEQGESITTDHMRQILDALRSVYEFVVLDTSTGYDERVLLMLDTADWIVVPVAPDMAAIKSVAAFLRLCRLLGLSSEKLLLVLVRADSVSRNQIGQIETFLHRRFNHHIPSDGRTATRALNEGMPIVLHDPHTALAHSLEALAALIDSNPPS